MHTVLAFVIGTLYATGVYLLLQRSMVKIIMGLVFLGNGSNLLIFAMGGLVSPYPDPLPQALILTAIVISFGVLAFLLVLVYQAHNLTGTEDLDSLKTTDT